MKKLFLGLIFMSLSGCYFYEVDPGKVYRAPQPEGDALEKAVKEYGIKTVLNLRGDKPNDGWYQKEKDAAARLGVDLIDIPMSAKTIPSKKSLVLLLDSFKNARYPILIHCKAGVDRTGEAAALYQMLYMGKSLKQALNMLSTKFYHLPTFMPAKTYFVKKVWKGEDWARNEYNPCSGQYKYYDVNSAECLERGLASDQTLTEEDDVQ